MKTIVPYAFQLSMLISAQNHINLDMLDNVQMAR